MVTGNVGLGEIMGFAPGLPRTSHWLFAGVAAGGAAFGLRAGCGADGAGAGLTAIGRVGTELGLLGVIRGLAPGLPRVSH